MKNLSIILIFLAMSNVYAQQPAYKNPSLPISQRVNDLLQHMTLEEQAAQLYELFSRDTLAFDANGNFLSVQDTAILNRGVGSFGTWALWRERSLRHRVQCINGIQQYMIEKTRLGIPIFTFGESLHGFMANSATSFPQAIALGCTLGHCVSQTGLFCFGS